MLTGVSLQSLEMQRAQALSKRVSVYLAPHTPAWLVSVPFLGGYISCPSHETPPEEKTRERTERSVDGCWMKEAAEERPPAHGETRCKRAWQVQRGGKKSDALENIEKKEVKWSKPKSDNITAWEKERGRWERKMWKRSEVGNINIMATGNHGNNSR